MVVNLRGSGFEFAFKRIIIFTHDFKIIGIFVEADLKTLCDRALESNMPISVPIRMFSQLELPDLSEGFDYIYEKIKLL